MPRRLAAVKLLEVSTRGSMGIALYSHFG
jgi:hypothetical protein